MDTMTILAFKNREVKAKDVFEVKDMPFDEAYQFIRKYHYLGDVKPFGCRQWGLYCDGELVGVSMFGSPQGTLTLRGWFGGNESGVYELVRLAMLPELNGTNATSYLLSYSIRELKKVGGRAVITLADSQRHVGSIYQVCNFKYYGPTNKKSDFYVFPSGEKHVRGKTKDLQGVWIPRTTKHRYAYIMDRRLKVLYEECAYPQKHDTTEAQCCRDGVVYDTRYGVAYTCPLCNRPMRVLP